MWRELAGIPGKSGLGVPAEETVGSCVDAVSAAFYAPHPGQHAAWAEWITAWLELLLAPWNLFYTRLRRLNRRKRW